MLERGYEIVEGCLAVLLIFVLAAEQAKKISITYDIPYRHNNQLINSSL